jgi:putative transcriptional regulator
MTLAEAIKSTRMKSLLSQEDFAKKLNVSVGSINRWENGKTKPNIIAMKAIKAFCQENSLDYKIIEKEWLNYSKNSSKG